MEMLPNVVKNSKRRPHAILGCKLRSGQYQNDCDLSWPRKAHRLPAMLFMGQLFDTTWLEILRTHIFCLVVVRAARDHQRHRKVQLIIALAKTMVVGSSALICFSSKSALTPCFGILDVPQYATHMMVFSRKAYVKA